MTGSVDYLVRGNLVNVKTGTIEHRSIAIDGSEIVALEKREANTVIESSYITPGLIDAHVHIESSMVTLPQYARAVVPRGITSIIHDPHEIGNVLGKAGVESIIEDATAVPLKARFGVPSSVPATRLQDTGATIGVEETRTLLGHDRVVALAEVMDIPGLIAGDPAIHAKIEAATDQDVTVDGHLPRITGAELQEASRYLDTDHESISLEEALEKCQNGLRVFLREASTSHDLRTLVGLVEQVDSRYLSLCSDDRTVVDLANEGSVDNALQQAVEYGVDFVEAIQMATINTAEAYDLPFGTIEPGAPADMVLLNDLETWDVEHVFVDGTIDPFETRGDLPDSTLQRDTVTFDPVSPEDLQITPPKSNSSFHQVRVIDVGEFQTESMIADVQSTNGALVANRSEDVLPATVIERHGGEGTIGNGFIHGFGLARGAIGSTVAHDAHNLIAVGVTHEAMARVANHLRETGGGIAVFDPATDTCTTLELPVAGLVSDEPLDRVKDQFQAVATTARDLGFSHPGGISELTFLALEVVPEIRLTNNGLVDVRANDYVDVVVE